MESRNGAKNADNQDEKGGVIHQLELLKVKN
jgi:hypothetical protein